PYRCRCCAPPYCLPHRSPPPPLVCVKAQENIVATLLNLSISAHEALMSPRASSTPLSSPSASSPLSPQPLQLPLYRRLPFHHWVKEALIVALVDLLSAPNASTRSIKDALKALFGLDLYSLNRTTLVELGVMLPLFMLVVKNGRKGVVEDVTIHRSIPRVDDVSVLVDGGSERARETITIVLLNLVKSNGDKVVGDIKEVDEVEATMRALDDDESQVSTRRKSKVKVLLKVLERTRDPTIRS
ncbi:unnamed protein product, partial [Musa banksii]